MTRLFLEFDCSAFDGTETVTAASLTFNVASAGFGPAHTGSPNREASVTVSTHSTNFGEASGGDFDNVEHTALTTPGNEVSVASTGSKTLTLSATGISHVQSAVTAQGVCKLCIRDFNYDIANIDPASGANPDWYFSITTPSSGGASEPKLEITHE